ncbi:cytochrome P450 [Suillus fuscotomentosus]|uniref:Cytochrome P450 n=1 Tax=Suillus fuscotomentosus TaxID=1912939 RepID=A0AAD4HK60_9AGAM|nr:cytochrome P450 [Suillus fuscotomentosus]KAG1899593.1 cytochrome P450 [Suillus fuscotomentosus]
MFPSVDGRLANLAILLASFIVITSLKRFITNRQKKLPPGPVPLPLLGNVLSLDTKAAWLTYTEWAAAYGDLFFVRLLGQEVVVINSQHVAEALLDKRSRIYSDRPYIATLEPFGWSVVFFRPMQIKQAREMIANLIGDPQNYHSHFATFSASVAMSVTYGYQTSPHHDPLVRIVENALAIGLEVVTPEKAILLKTFPFLLKLPDWCWGSSIKCDARTSSDRMREMTDVPFQYAQDHMFSMVAENLQRIEKQDQTSRSFFEGALKKAATTAIIGSSGFVMTFALAMVLYPDVQRRAQAEIDSVVGLDRLPTFEDRTSLPYVESVLRETLRWQPVLPLGVPHVTTGDDTYDGYFIPKGTTVMCNVWGITRDEKRYLGASRFTPERFLDVNGALTDDDPAGYIFGFGRRACPGRYAADASLWSAIVTMLATVEFSSAKDDQGKVIEFTPQFTTGITRSFIALAPLWSSLAISHHALVPIRNL